MKEFNYIFDEGIKKGLRQYSNNPLNEQALIDLLNVKVGKKGLIAYEDIKNVPGDLSISWPFPLIFTGAKYCFVASQSSIYNVGLTSIAEDLDLATADSILDSLDDEILDELSEAITWTNFETLTGFTIGDYWDFADFGSYILLTNGSVIVFIDYVTDYDSPSVAYMTSSSTFPRCKTYCNFKGQIIGGNVQSSWHDCDETSIVWSQIGHADFTPKPSMEAGFKILNEFPGAIHKVLRLGKGVAVYGNNGIIFMQPEGVPFGFYEVLDIGIPSIKAINGNEKEQVFVDNLSKLWRWRDGEKPIELDYSEHIDNLTLANIVVSVDKAKKEYYISDGVRCYLLTDYGLSEVYQRPTSVFHYNGNTYGVCDKSSNTGFRLETDVIDFGVRGQKTIVALELGLRHTTNVLASIAWSSNIAGSFSYSPTKLINPNGVCYPKVTSDDMRIKLTSTAFANISLDYMNVRLNTTDKRSVRGRINVT